MKKNLWIDEDKVKKFPDNLYEKSGWELLSTRENNEGLFEMVEAKMIKYDYLVGNEGRGRIPDDILEILVYDVNE